MTAENPASPGPRPPTEMEIWIDQVRHQEAPAPPPPPPCTPRSSRAVRGVSIVLSLVALGLGLNMVRPTRAPAETDPGRGGITGTVRDADGRPLEGSVVFVASAPSVQALSGEDGRFRLSKAPGGPQLLVVVVDEIGQEFAVTVARDVVSEAGTLVYGVSADERPEP